MKGSAMNHRDLIRANIMEASKVIGIDIVIVKVVILSPRVDEISKATFDDDNPHYNEEEQEGKKVI